MDDLTALLRAQEEALLTAEVRGSRVALERLLAEEFVEFGSSGRVFDRKRIIAALLQEDAGGLPEAEIREFRCVRLGNDAALVTYTAVREGARASLRSSVWVLRQGRWVMVFHQGTRAAEDHG